MSDEPSYLAFARVNVRERGLSTWPVVEGLVERIDRDAKTIAKLTPRTITTVAEMMTLPNDSIVRDRNGLALHRGVLGNWHASNGIRDVQPDEMETDAFPATVLYEPAQ